MSFIKLNNNESNNNNFYLVPLYKSYSKKNKKPDEKIQSKKIVKKFKPKMQLKNNLKIDIHSFLNVNKVNNRYEYSLNELFNKKLNSWDLKWTKIDNCLEFSQDIWIKNWIKLKDNLNTSIVKNIIKPTIPSIFSCKILDCKEVYTSKKDLKKHSLTHKEKLYICKIENCGKKFFDYPKLKRHNLVHSGEKAYQCNKCLKKFSLDFNLKTHIRTHSNLKPFACNFPDCRKRFTQSSNLISHNKVHSEDYIKKSMEKKEKLKKEKKEKNAKNAKITKPDDSKKISKRGRKKKTIVESIPSSSIKLENDNN